MRRGILLLLVTAAASPALPAGPLFPEPLHLTREVSDPISGRSSTIDEYYVGDRAIAVAGEVVAIADYGSGELVRIDLRGGTYSVAGFDALARAGGEVGGERGAAGGPEMERAGAETVEGRPVELWRGRSGEGISIEVAIDRSIVLTRDAVEAIVGAAFPGSAAPEQRAALTAAAPPSAGDALETQGVAAFGLPLETAVSYAVGGERVTLRNRITRVGRELPPASLLAPPAGARRVEHDLVEAARLLRAFDRLPGKPPRER